MPLELSGSSIECLASWLSSSEQRLVYHFMGLHSR